MNVTDLTRRQALLSLLGASVVAGSASWPRAWQAETLASSGTQSENRLIALVVFPDLTTLDLVGPLQVLRALGRPYHVALVGERLEPVNTDTGLQVAPQLTFAHGVAPLAVLVPGGPGSVAAMANDALQRYLLAAGETAAIVSSVCTGAFVLAATGLLEGRRATTHWAYAAELEKLGARYVRARWVEDGKFITAAGVSAGIDLSLFLVARLTDDATARRIQLGMEYDPQPPFGRIDWSRVGEQELARQRQGGTGSRLRDAATILRQRPDLLKKLGIPVTHSGSPVDFEPIGSGGIP